MAIARDNHTDGGLVNPGTSLSFNHTVAGNDRILLVAVFGNTSGTNGNISGVTYNNVAMTQVNFSAQVPTDNRIVTLWSLIAPALGTNVVKISANASVAIHGQAASYTGVDQGIGVDNSATKTNASAASVTTTLVTGVDDCWLFLVGKSQGTVTLSAGAGATLLDQSNNIATFDSNASVGVAGSYNMTANLAPNGTFGGVIASLAPAAATTTSTSSSLSTSSSISTSSTSASTSTSTSKSTSTSSTSSSLSTSTSTTVSTSSTSSSISTSTSTSTTTLIIQDEYPRANIRAGRDRSRFSLVP